MVSWSEIGKKFKEGGKLLEEKIAGGYKYYSQKLEGSICSEKTIEVAKWNDVSADCFNRIKNDGYTLVDLRNGEVLDKPAGKIADVPQDADVIDYCLEQYALLGYDAQYAHSDEL